VDPVNDAPIVTVPTLQTVAEDLPIVLSGVTVSDIDAGQIQLTLTAPNGLITVRNNVTGGVTPGDILNNAAAR